MNESKAAELSTEEGRAGKSQADNATPKRHFPFAAIPILLLLIAAGTLVWYFVFRQSTAPANMIQVSGRIESDDAVIAPKTSGKIKQINVREGDQVKAGQVVAVLNDDQMRAREDQAQAALSQAEARARRAEQQIAVLQTQRYSSELGVDQSKLDAQGRVRQAEEQILQAQSQVGAAEAQLAQAKANFNLASYDLEKFKRLFATGDTSERQLRQIQSNADSLAEIVRAQQKQVEVARGSLKAIRANLSAVRAGLANPAIRSAQTATIDKQIIQAQSDIDSANADTERARAQLNEARSNRDDLNILAPFDGTVATRSVEPGEVVSAGTPILTVVNFNAVYLTAYVPESEIGRVRVGQAARVYLDSDPNQPVDAEVIRINPEATFTPENTYFQNDRVKQVVGVKLGIKNPQGYAKPGMPADGEILVDGEWKGSVKTAK